jgi:hypothetical protein
METFGAPKALVANPDFAAQRRRSLVGLTDEMLDAPLRRLIRKLNGLPYCFTLQCCYGHFVHAGQSDPHNLAPLSTAAGLSRVTYRIAYVALCLDASIQGKQLLETLKGLPRLDPSNIQFGSAAWFWRQQVNTYALQVEPERFKFQDQAVLDGPEALKIERLRTLFFERFMDAVEKFSPKDGE